MIYWNEKRCCDVFCGFAMCFICLLLMPVSIVFTRDEHGNKINYFVCVLNVSSQQPWPCFFSVCALLLLPPSFLASEDQEVKKMGWIPVQPDAPEQTSPDQTFLMMDVTQPRRWFPCPLNNHLFCFLNFSALRCNWSVVYRLLFQGPEIALYSEGSQWAHFWLDGSLYPCSWLIEKPS